MTARFDTKEAPSIRDAEVVAWRRAQLIAAGFDLGISDRLARECGFDLHELVDLVGAGCTPDLAARILAPLDDESRRC